MIFYPPQYIMYGRIEKMVYALFVFIDVLQLAKVVVKLFLVGYAKVGIIKSKAMCGYRDLE